MWVSALAYLLSRGWSIYSEQVPSRLDSPAHRGDFIVDVLEGTTVRDIWAAVSNGSTVSTVTIDTPLTKIVELMPQTTQDVFPVLDAEGHYYGMFGLNDFRRFVFNPEVGRIAIAEDLAVTTLEPLRLDTGLSVAMGRFARTDYAELPIVSDDGRQFLGLLRRQEVVAAYNARLAVRRTKP
jgi:CIC family chloride channel protein